MIAMPARKSAAEIPAHRGEAEDRLFPQMHASMLQNMIILL